MKRWWGWVFAWLGVVGLLFSLGIEMTGVNHPGHAGWARSRTRGTFLSISSSPTLLATATQLLRSRAGPVESFVTPGALLTAADVGPPWLEYREPPGCTRKTLGEWQGCRPRRQLPAGTTRSSDEIPSPPTDQLKKLGFGNSL